MKNVDRDRLDMDGFEENLIKLNRVAKVVKGGRRFAFTALIVVGDHKGHVGLGYGKANEVPEAIRKGVEDAKKNIITVSVKGTTIPHRVDYKFGSATIMLKPAREGTGIVAGSAARAVVEFAGIKDILSKRYGSSNAINIAKATFEALKQLMKLKEVAERRGKTLKDFFGSAAEEPSRTDAPDENNAAEEVTA
jgi:small subunit ribosomal protein S5